MRGKLCTLTEGHQDCLPFNEARALCAGSSQLARSLARRQPSFNEARALCAGSYVCRGQRSCDLRPSMRPAHYAREVMVVHGETVWIEFLQ